MFKNGDVVVCTNSSGASDLTKGFHYVVQIKSGCSITYVINDKGYCDWYSPDRFELAEKPVTKSEKILEISEGFWVTQDGYVVQLVEINGHFYSTIETSPGTTSFGSNIEEVNKKTADSLKGVGWGYSILGQSTLSGVWGPKLKIVEKLEVTMPDLPKGYRHKDGFPQYRLPIIGDLFMMINSKGSYESPAIFDKFTKYLYGPDKRRFILEKIETSVATPVQTTPTPVEDVAGWYVDEKGYYVQMNSEYIITYADHQTHIGLKVKDMPSLGTKVEAPPTPPEGYKWPNNIIQKRVPKKGEFYIGTLGVPLEACQEIYFTKYFITCKDAELASSSTPSEKETDMSPKELRKFADELERGMEKEYPTLRDTIYGNRKDSYGPLRSGIIVNFLVLLKTLLFQILNFCVFEPAKMAAKPLYRTVQFGSLLAATGGIIWAGYNYLLPAYQQIKHNIPTIDVKWNEATEPENAEYELLQEVATDLLGKTSEE